MKQQLVKMGIKIKSHSTNTPWDAFLQFTILLGTDEHTLRVGVHKGSLKGAKIKSFHKIN